MYSSSRGHRNQNGNESPWKEKPGSPSYVTLATLMLVAIGLYAVLPPLMSRERFPNNTPPPIHGSSQTTPGGTGSVPPNTDTAVHADSKERDDPFIVYTQYGPIRSTERAGVRVFHGVRFAAPPVNHLRWREPQPVQPWGPAVYDATWVRPGCPQKFETVFYPANGTSEDCLYLEIYAPFANNSSDLNPNQAERHGIPVLIYVHGGGFRDMSSTTSIFDAAYLAARGNMIVVLPDYRIGSLGFLFTGTSSNQVSGNFGLLDQKFAIEWAVNNIEAFGGDPNKITLAGHSAGALSVVVHLTTANTARRFRHVILSSAPLSIPFRTTDSAINKAHTLARQLGCLHEQTSEPEMECLRNKSVKEIRAAEDYMAGHAAPALGALLDRINPWGPVIDGEIVKASPLDSMFQFTTELASDISKLKPMIMGLTTDEASMFLDQASKYKSMGRLYLAVLSSLTGADLNTMADLYPVNDTNDVSEDIATSLTDFMFRCPLRALQRRLVAPHLEMEGNTSRVAGVKFWPYLWRAPMSGDLPSDIEFCRGKSCHGAELPFLFRSSNQSARQPDKHQLNLSNAVIDYVANFVATGDPNNFERYENEIVNEISKTQSNNIDKENDKWKRSSFVDRAKSIIKRTIQYNNHIRKKREVGRLHKMLKHLKKRKSQKLSPEYNKRDVMVNRVETQHRRQITEHHPYWKPVTSAEGFSVEPTWLFRVLNFPGNSKIRMAKQAVIKGRQCDIWDQTEYKFPKLFGS